MIAAQAVAGPERCGGGQLDLRGEDREHPVDVPRPPGLLERQHREELFGLLLTQRHELADEPGVAVELGGRAELL